MNAVLQAILGLNTGPFKAGIRDAEGSARGLQISLRSIGQTLGVAFSVAGAMAAARSVATWASGISEAAQNVGILSSEMLALNSVAETNGLKVEDLANGRPHRFRVSLERAVAPWREIGRFYAYLAPTGFMVFQNRKNAGFV